MSDRIAPPTIQYDERSVKWNKLGTLLCAHCYRPFGSFPDWSGNITIVRNVRKLDWSRPLEPQEFALFCAECLYALIWRDIRNELERDAREIEGDCE